MLTHRMTPKAIVRTRPDVRSALHGADRVVIVNGSSEALELIETVLEAGRYNVVFVESNAHAYSQIKRVQPNLVILCMRVGDIQALQVLSMLKLDGETRAIPVVTWTLDCDQSEDTEENSDDGRASALPFAPVSSMN